MKSNRDEVEEFHEAFGLPRPDKFTVPSNETITLRKKLINEELKELMDELDVMMSSSNKTNAVKISKELCDLVYVVLGLAVTLGIPFDDCFDEVHRSNMSKLTKDGKVLTREDGKVLKSDQYSPADLTPFFSESELYK